MNDDNNTSDVPTGPTADETEATAVPPCKTLAELAAETNDTTGEEE